MPNPKQKPNPQSESSRAELVEVSRFSSNATDTLADLAAQSKRIELQRAQSVETPDQALWIAIRNRTLAIGFKPYQDFIDRVLCHERTVEQPLCGHDDSENEGDKLRAQWGSHLPAHFRGVDAYNLLKVATEVFLIFECGVAIRPPKQPATGVPAAGAENTVIPGEEDRGSDPLTFAEAEGKLQDYLKSSLQGYLGAGKLPYLNRIVDALFPGQDKPVIHRPFCDGILRHRWACPCLLELIWSFWHEEAMLVQTLNAISLRFQNKRGPVDPDPLARLKLDPLRPLSNVIWGYIQDEINRLSLPRRVYEYDHHYGLTLVGKAVPQIRSVDSRSKFLEAYHNLLYVASRFYREDDDTTVIADAFPVLNALKEVHLLLAYGAHNQFGDLPWTARVEMLIQQWLLARPEIREYLGGPPMVPYQEDWMGAVDTMKALQGWSDVSVSHFRDLAVYGEQILLSIRYGDWVDVNDQQQARNWARSWRPEIQSYMHSYRAVTGVDLTAEVTDTRQAEDRYVQPAVHHAQRLEQQKTRHIGELPVPAARRNGSAGTSARPRVPVALHP